MAVRQREQFREEQEMRKLVILAVLVIILLLALAQFGPSAIFGAGLNQIPAPGLVESNEVRP